MKCDPDFGIRVLFLCHIWLISGVQQTVNEDGNHLLANASRETNDENAPRRGSQSMKLENSMYLQRLNMTNHNFLLNRSSKSTKRKRTLYFNLSRPIERRNGDRCRGNISCWRQSTPEPISNNETDFEKNNHACAHGKAICHKYIKRMVGFYQKVCTL